MFAAFLPIWFLVTCGVVAARFNVLGDQAARVLTAFAFHIAMPAVLFTSLSRAPLDALPLRPVAALAAGTVAVGLLGFAAARWLFRDRLPDQIMTALSAGYLNSGNLGIPVAVNVLDDTLLIAAIMILHTSILTPLFLLAMDACTGESDGRRRARRWLAPLRNPIVLASLSGLALNASGLRLPELVFTPIEVLGASAVPVALVALGLSLFPASSVRSELHWGQVTVVTVLKTLAHPLLAYCAARFAFGLDGADLFAVTLLAALPTAQVVFVYADRYRAKTDVTGAVVAASSVVSIVVLAAVALLLG